MLPGEREGPSTQRAHRSILTIECEGPVKEGHAPFLCAPFAELGGGDPQNAPTLVRMGNGCWSLQAAVQGLGTPLDTSAWRTGLRSLDLLNFKTGSGLEEPPASLRWCYRLEAANEPGPVHLFYYSGWPRVTARLADAQRQLDMPLEPDGCGRRPGETLWTAELPVHEFAGDWGMALLGPGEEIDRAPGGGLYRPLGSCIHLADGEIFSGPPPTIRSAPRIETVHFDAPEMQHTFLVHVVLPRDYDIETDRAYPLVYLNDGHQQLTGQGASGGWHTDSVAAALMREGQLRDCVLAAVEMYPDRERAYFPSGTHTKPEWPGRYLYRLVGRPPDRPNSRHGFASPKNP
jgi:hypothetical protein